MAHLRLGILLFLVSLWMSCANPNGTLTGGADDLTPPKLDSTKFSTPNFSTNFSEKEIILTFDEWVKLDDAFNQVIISPPLAEQPELKIKRKSVIIDLAEEELKENTTYSIQFGTAIQDITKNNPTELKFVFSTGDKIDSIGFQGSVLDAYTSEPVEGVLVMLYDQLEDSVVTNERPYYFAKTDKTGNFKITNVKADTFKLFALKDNNFNYKFDLPNELIGYSDDYFILTDSSQERGRLLLFEEKAALKVNEVTNSFGKVKIEFNQEFEELEKVFSPAKVAEEIRWEERGDSLVLFFLDLLVDSFDLYLSSENWRDTIEVKNLKESNDKNKAGAVQLFTKVKAKSMGVAANRGQTKKEESKTGISRLNPLFPARIKVNRPIAELDEKRTQLWIADSIRLEDPFVLNVKEEDINSLELTAKFKDKTNYKIVFLPGAITDFYGNTNDSIVYRFKTKSKEDYGTIVIKAEGLDENQRYLIQLIHPDMTVVEEEKIEGLSTFSKTYQGQEKGDYRIRLVHDRNGNGKWDGGNYYEKRQPEKVSFTTISNLRANWDLEIKISLKQKE